jgi:hypothetical protein
MHFFDKSLEILGEIGSNATNLRLLGECLDQLVPFIGAGLSADFGYPQWGQFLREAAGHFGLPTAVEPLLAGQQFEEAADALAQDRPKAFDDFLREAFDERKLVRPLRKGAVQCLARIARGPVLTTNFDRVLEAAFEDAGRRFEEVFPGSNIREASRAIQFNRPFLLKLHGDYRDSASRVLTLREYTREYGSDEPGRVNFELPMPSVLAQVLGARPLLFLGCSLKSDRTTLIIAQIARRLPGTVHFAVLSESENTADRFHQLDAWNIRPLFFPAGRFEKIEELLDSIADASPALSPRGPRPIKQTFFSYARDDSKFALRLGEDLRAAGVSIWLDQLDIEPGQRWDRAVQSALVSCPRMLVVLSPSSVESDNVMDEVSFALEKKKTVIPVLWRDCEIPFRLRRVQYIDCRVEYDRGLKRLLDTLAALTKQEVGQAEEARQKAKPEKARKGAKEREKARAGRKAREAAEQPKQTFEAELGKIYLGKVVRLADFGAFVEIFPGAEGLLHISELAEDRVEDIREELTEGDQVLVMVISIDGDKIRLSRKAVLRRGLGP